MYMSGKVILVETASKEFRGLRYFRNHSYTCFKKTFELLEFPRYTELDHNLSHVDTFSLLTDHLCLQISIKPYKKFSALKDANGSGGRQQVPGSLRGIASTWLVGEGHPEAGWHESYTGFQGSRTGKLFSLENERKKKRETKRDRERALASSAHLSTPRGSVRS